MIRVSRRLIAGLSLGASVFALPAAPAAWAQDEESLKDSPAYCGDDTDRRCGPLVDDSIVERRGVAPNLERGDAGHAEAFRLSVDGVPTAEGDTPNAADRDRSPRSKRCRC